MLLKRLGSVTLWVTVTSLLAGLYVFMYVQPHWVEQKTVYETTTDQDGNLYYSQNGKTLAIEAVVPYQQSVLL